MEVEAEVKNEPKGTDLKIIKKDNLYDSSVQGAAFRVTNTENVKDSSLLIGGITGLTGEFKLSNIRPEQIGKPFSIELEELHTVNGLHVTHEIIKISWTSVDSQPVIEQDGGYACEITNFDGDSEPTVTDLTITNDNCIEKLVIHKTDYVTGEELKDVEFYITIDAGGVVYNDIQATDDSGNITLKDIVIKSDQITLTLKEVTPPAPSQDEHEAYYYKEIEQEMVFNIKYKEFGLSYGLDIEHKDPDEPIKQGAIVEKRFDEIADISAVLSTITIKNVPLMEINGYVWIDDQEGNKKVTPANGKYDSDKEKLVKGVDVYLYKKEIGVDFATGDPLLEATTDDNGRYHFEDLESPRGDYTGIGKITSIEGYIVDFEYNGIDYRDDTKREVSAATGISYIPISDTKSKAFEGNNFGASAIKTRAELNEKSKKIEKDNDLDEADNKKIELQYKRVNEEEVNIREVHLDAEIDGTNPKTGKKDFAVRSRSELVTQTAHEENNDSELNFGMIKRFFDLKLDMIINCVKLTINNKETVYDYEKEIAWLDGELGELKKAEGEDRAKDQSVEKTANNGDQNLAVDLKLYDSDYRYRIEDYEKDLDLSREDVDDVDSEKDIEIIKAENTRDQQLRAFVTYEVAIMNQSYVESKVEELTYYYDKAYTLIRDKVNPDKIYSVSTKLKDGMADPDYAIDCEYPVDMVNDKKVIHVKNFGENLNDDNDYRQVLYFTFEIDRTGDSERLPKSIEDATKTEEEGQKFSNIVEITKYSTTEGGYVDNDSCPGNCSDSPTSGWQNPWEDDTYGAKALRVSLTNQKRSIEGYVWDDKNKDGKMYSDEDKLDNVTVQLVEIKNIPDAAGNTKYREAIWQQTASGSKEVTTRNSTGVSGNKYENGVTETGKYKFEGFIPGDYIVRFIYGDGLYQIYKFNGSNIEEYSSVNDTLRENIKKYNGQDYQSTKDEKYQEADYNIKKPDKEKSVARDNEARRLNVMAYSAVIDGPLGEALNSIGEKDISKLTDKQKELLLEYYQSANVPEHDSSKTEVDLDVLKAVQNRVLENTWMSAETSKLTVNINEEDSETADISGKTEVTTSSENPVIETSSNPDLEIDYYTIKYDKLDFGIHLRPQTKLKLEKHVTAFRVGPAGVGITPLVEARGNIKDILNKNKPGSTEAFSVKDVNGIKSHLKIMPSTRTERGFWNLETDIEELTQSALLTTEYTYVVINEGEEDYLSEKLVKAYRDYIGKDEFKEGYDVVEEKYKLVAGTKNNEDDYITYLNSMSKNAKKYMKSEGFSNSNLGTYLGEYYYKHNDITNKDDRTKQAVPSQVNEINDNINNKLNFVEDSTKAVYSGAGFETAASNVTKHYYDTNGAIDTMQVNTVIRNKYNKADIADSNNNRFDIIIRQDRDIDLADDAYYDDDDVTDGIRNISYKTVLLSRTLDVKELQESNGISMPSYISEIVEFSNAAGRRDMKATPENLDYVHSEDTQMHLEVKYIINGSSRTYCFKSPVTNKIYSRNVSSDTEWQETALTEIPLEAISLNEKDEFWGETIVITKPTGEDKQFPVAIVVIAVSSVAVLGVGIILIKKYVLAK